MKKLITITVVAMLFVCTSAMATTISWGTASSGAKDNGGAWLLTGDLAQLWQDDDEDGIGANDDLLATAAIGDGFGSTNGNFFSQVDVTVNPNDVFYIKVYDAPTAAGAMWGFSATTTIPSEVPVGVIGVAGPGMITNLPEPSSLILVSGMALLLLRKRK